MGKILHGNFNTKIKLRKKAVAIIAAGGKGTRMGLDFNKIFLNVNEKPILAYTLDVFEYSSCIDAVILVCSAKKRYGGGGRKCPPGGSTVFPG